MDQVFETTFLVIFPTFVWCVQLSYFQKARDCDCLGDQCR